MSIWIIDFTINLNTIGTRNLWYIPAMADELVQLGVAEEDAFAFASFAKNEFKIAATNDLPEFVRKARQSRLPSSEELVTQAQWDRLSLGGSGFIGVPRMEQTLPGRV